MSPEPGYYVIRQATVGDPHGDSAAPMYMADNGIGLKMTAKKLDTNPDKWWVQPTSEVGVYQIMRHPPAQSSAGVHQDVVNPSVVIVAEISQYWRFIEVKEHQYLNCFKIQRFELYDGKANHEELLSGWESGTLGVNDYIMVEEDEKPAWWFVHRSLDEMA